MDYQAVALQIQSLRKSKGITQAELGERLHISSQAVSKWERAETLPDVTILPDLASILETTIDNILMGGAKIIQFGHKATVDEMKNGIEAIKKIGELLGKNSSFYIGAVEGINSKMNIDFEECLTRPYLKEGLIAEATIQAIIGGAYIDISDIRKSFEFPHWVEIVTGFAEKYGIK